MPRAFVNVMRHFESPVVWIVYMSPMFTSTIAQTLPSLADVGPLAIGADEKVDDIFSLAIHFLLDLECKGNSRM